MIVVDVNIICYLLIPTEHTAAVQALAIRGEGWVAPSLWKDEFVNVLCTYERVGNHTSSDSRRLLLASSDLIGESYEIDPLRTLAVARRTGCSGYDSQYLALAEDLGTRLYTFDKRVLKAAPELATRPSAL